MSATNKSAALVTLDYEEILRDPSPTHSLSKQLERAFGSDDTLGIVAIRNVPGFVEAKEAVLPLAHKLAHLPADYLEQELTDPASLYNAGWSHGKEKLGNNAPDIAKGSFYFNPLTDLPGTAQDRVSYPRSYPRNIWPTKRLPDLEPNAKAIGVIMREVIVQLAKHIDAFAKEKLGTSSYPDSLLYDVMKSTDKVKGRLLYYFPLSPSSEDEKHEPVQPVKEDSWSGWHNDSSFLTALAGDIYVNDETGEQVLNPDPDAGLYVINRKDQVVKVDLPSDFMAVQMGECAQILTGGAVVATPHCVRGASAKGLARISLPVFIDSPPGFALTMPPAPCTRKQVLEAGVGTNRVPPLELRWTEDGMKFGDFLHETFSQYYAWLGKN